MSEIFYVCRACAEGKTLEELRGHKPIVIKQGDATYRGWTDCGRTILASIDGDTLDLGLVTSDPQDQAGTLLPS